MTNEQAIEQLKGIRSDYEADCKNSPFKATLYQKDIEAIDFALKALKDDCVENEILDIIHKTIYQFIDLRYEEEPMSDKDKLLLEVNKAICNNLRRKKKND